MAAFKSEEWSKHSTLNTIYMGALWSFGAL